MDRFWSSGYSGTSLDDLSAACGLNRPSLYAAFGNKQSLYLSALEHFSTGMAARLAPALEQNATLEAALKAFFRKLLDVYFSGDSEAARGCMVLCTATVEAPNDPAVAAYLKQTLKAIDQLLEGRFARAIAEAELPQDSDAAMLGALAAALMHSIATRARAGESRASLRRLGDAAARRLSQG